MRRTALPPLVYAQLYPHPRSCDPQSFAAHLTKLLIPEVRLETQTFYGTLDCIEAKYPGLDYTHPPHRMRLGRFTHHRRLFRAFDELGLTKIEILNLCRWEGTRWARERYEREEGIKVRDTTGDEIVAWVEPSGVRCPRSSPAGGVDMDYEAVSDREGLRGAMVHAQHEVEEGRGEEEVDEEVLVVEDEDEDDDQEQEEEEESEEEEIESVGIELNRRLSAAAAMRDRGAADVVMDEAWEQWLKEASERGVLADPIGASRAGHTFPPIASLAGQMSQGNAPTPTNLSTTATPRASTIIP